MTLDKTDHDLLTRIDERVERIDIRMNSHSESIRSLERFRAWILGGVGVITFIIMITSEMSDHFIGDGQ